MIDVVAHLSDSGLAIPNKDNWKFFFDICEPELLTINMLGLA
jgi:hypothetical protein